MFENILEKENNIHISIGEEGSVVLYYNRLKLINKFFIKKADDKEAAELTKILLNDSNASIHIYIDILDQSYVQRTLPAINVFSINSLANQRLIKETPKSHLKALLQIGKTGTSRNDWIYMFISAAMEPPISDWIYWLEKYPNIIVGIHFLPIELIALVRKLVPQSTKASYNNLFKKFFNKKALLQSLPQVEILLTMNKTGGFRQVIYLNDKIILTRLLNDAYDPNSDVVAGNLEKELLNSIEYIRRLTFLENCEIVIIIIVSNEIKRHIRRNKFNVKEIKLFTPHEAAKIANINKDIVQVDDRFCDPLILSVLQSNKRRIITTYTNDLKKIFKYTSIFKKIITCLKVVLPLFALSIFIHFYNIYIFLNDVNSALKKQAEISNDIDVQNGIKNREVSRFGSKYDVEQIEQIVDIYTKQKNYNTNPLQIFQKIGEVRSDIARVQQIEVKFNPVGLKYSNLASSQPQSSPPQPYLQSRFTVVLKNFGNSYEELIANYNDYKHKLTTKFAEYKVSISELPKNFTFEDFKKPISLNVILETNSTEVKK